MEFVIQVCCEQKVDCWPWISIKKNIKKTEEKESAGSWTLYHSYLQFRFTFNLLLIYSFVNTVQSCLITPYNNYCKFVKFLVLINSILVIVHSLPLFTSTTFTLAKARNRSTAVKSQILLASLIFSYILSIKIRKSRNHRSLKSKLCGKVKNV